MPVSVPMPRLGESVTEGTVTRWLKQEGDRVEVDEPLLEVSTDKVDTEIPSPAAGVLTRIVVQEDETAEVGAELAVISGDEEGGGESGGGGESDGGGESGGAAPEQAAAEAKEDQGQQEAASAEKTTPAEENEPAPAQAEAAPPQEQPTDQDETPAQSSGGGQAGSSGGTTVVKMPALGESVTEGTVTRWLKQVGENVDLDEPLLEVSTDKVDTEIPSPAAGTLLEIKVQQDETADVGAELAVIGSAGVPAEGHATESAPAPAAEATKAPEPQRAPEPAREPAPAQAQQAPAPQAPAQPQPSGAGARTAQANGGDTAYVTPLVRKLASEHNVDLASLSGTGVGGRIRKQDVLEAAEKAKAAAAAPAPAPAQAQPRQEKAAPAKSEPSPLRGRTEKLTRTRISIAKRMYESLQSSAQLTTVVEVDVTKIARLRQQAKGNFQQQHGVKLSFLPFFAVAAVEALGRFPIVNASIDLDGGTVTYPDGEHLGIAVDTERGLLVPVIRDAGDLNLAGLARRIADLAERTRTNKISPDEISGATFTITNTGSRGALFDTPIVPKPQSAILGTGAVVKRAVVVDDPDLGEVITPRSMCYLALSYDHRIIDGADAARFLGAVKERLEGGHFEADLGLA